MRRLGDAFTELDVHGHFFGHCSLTLVLHGQDERAVQRQTAGALRAIAAHDGSLFEETYNLLNAWLSIVPGNGAHNLRRLALVETNLADLSFLFTRDAGARECAHLGRESLAIFETPHDVPYAFSLHVQDVGHILLLEELANERRQIHPGFGHRLNTSVLSSPARENSRKDARWPLRLSTEGLLPNFHHVPGL